MNGAGAPRLTPESIRDSRSPHSVPRIVLLLHSPRDGHPRSARLVPRARIARTATTTAPTPNSKRPVLAMCPGCCKHQSSSRAAGSRAAGCGQSRQRRTLGQHSPSGLRAVAGAASRSPLAGRGMSPLRSPGLRGRERESSRGDPVSRRPRLGRLRRAARIARSLAWRRRSDPQQAVEDLSEKSARRLLATAESANRLRRRLLQCRWSSSPALARDEAAPAAQNRLRVPWLPRSPAEGGV